MPHGIWILHGAKTRSARVQVLLKGISCSGGGQELPWQCKVSPLIFTKRTILSHSLGSAAWEASRMTRKQICRFCSFGVARLHTSCRCMWQGHPHGSHKGVWCDTHPRSSVLLCCPGQAGLLPGASHHTWRRATTLSEVLPARRRETWEVWALSGD